MGTMQLSMDLYNQTPLINKYILNKTTQQIKDSSSMQRNIEFYAAGLTLSCLIILMNIFVLSIFQLKKVLLLKSSVNIVLCSLAMNDTIAGMSILLYVIPFFMTKNHVVDEYKYGKVKIAGYIVSKQCLLLSIGHLVLLSCDRLLAVVSPLTHQIKFSRARAIICLLFTWAIAMALPILEFLLYEIIDLKIYTLVILICFVLIPFAILLCQYTITFVFIRKSIRNCRFSSLREKLNCKKAFVLHFMMFLSFFICAVPYVSVRTIMAYSTVLYQRIPLYVKDLFFCLRFLTSILNPLIYTIYKTDFQNVIKVIFCCKQKSREELELTLLRRTNALHRYLSYNSR